MITRSAHNLTTEPVAPAHRPAWQHILSDAITDPAALLRLLELDPALLPAAKKASESFRLRVPLPYIARMQKGNPDDPLLKQVLPVADELIETPGYSADPLGEAPKNAKKGILHKYRNRLLLMLGSACAVNCRFCFRRHFPYDDNKMNRAEWQEALDYIAADTSLTEVIFSGGDPLAVNDARLRWLTEAIAEIPHVKRLRIHTRLPIVVPQRITEEMLSWFTGTRLKPILVVHCNHAREIDADVCHSLTSLRNAGVTLLSQTVVLRGINDNVEAMVDLNETLFDNGVLPYYLHLFDKVQGAAHFDLDETRARRLLGEMSRHCSGYLVPRLAREKAGAPCKITLSPLYDD
ncbi:EF-P beta-lysylation protein EpmB [Kistimonas scapharcae]|uniref:L-lysine 2,3-aminomutase n=1 Tax=Kistimonas scapharcae TaxID=1036133 RepID=A0ABP8VB22_9GAMM